MEITKEIKYIGVDDTDLDLFESQYVVPNGISYNSYVILDDKIAVMDTVDHRKKNEWWTNLERELAGRTPDYLVVHHMEPDHAGNIAEFVGKYPDVKIVDITLTANQGNITLVDSTNNKTYNGTYTIVEETSKEITYKIVIGETTGYATLSPTKNYNGTEVPTLPINFGDYSLYFTPNENI